MPRPRFVAAALLAVALTAAAPAPNGGRTAGGTAWEATGRGPAVVMVHGSNLDLTMWDAHVPALAKRFRVIRYDLRAHGGTPAPADSFTWWRDLAEVLDAAGVRRAHVVGLSHGGRIALDFALAAPERVDRLVLAGAGIGGFQQTELPPGFGPILEAVRAQDFELAAARLAETEVFAVPDADSARVRTMVRASAPLFRANPRLERPLAPPAISRLAEVRCPTLVIVGGEDLAHNRLCADTLARAIPGARQVVVAGSPHLVNYHDPVAFDRLVIEFLAAKR